ncbi:MAG TPA: hypothetical protein VH877_02145, partial [Polyangia bacterium]|nr:hypothetical protein [Polyangia bacterium]
MRPRTASVVTRHPANFLRAALLLLLLPATVRAEDRSAARQAAKLYDDATEVFESGDSAKAAELLESAVALKPTPRAYLFLSTVYDRLQRTE